VASDETKAKGQRRGMGGGPEGQKKQRRVASDNMPAKSGAGKAGYAHGTITFMRAAHTPPLRLSALFGEQMNQFADFENCKSQIANFRLASANGRAQFENRKSQIANHSMIR